MTESLVVAQKERVTPNRGSKTVTVAWLDLKETLRARWYGLYVVGFLGLMGTFFVFGLSESQVMGFHGLGRTLMTFIQITIVVLPLFVLMTTARTLVGDREAGVFEYVMSLPVGLSAYYWGRLMGRGTAILAPLVIALLGGAVFEASRGGDVPWGIVVFYTALTASMVACFVGVATLISVLSRSQEMAVGAAFTIWLTLEALIDALLLGLMVQQRVPATTVVWVALINPLQAFRTAAIALFDPELTILGPISYTLLAELGTGGLLTWSLVWPTTLGVVTASIGAWMFVRRDTV